MRNMDILAYLFFLEKYNGVNNSFYSALFHFHRFISLETNFSWEKLFWFEEDCDYPKDSDFDLVIRTLFHHQYVDSKFKVTTEGHRFINKGMGNHVEFNDAMSLFKAYYNGESFKEKSCHIDNYSFPVSCHLCTNRLCQDTRFNVQDLLDLVKFKGFKNPYKKIDYQNPYSSTSE